MVSHLGAKDIPLEMENSRAEAIKLRDEKVQF